MITLYKKVLEKDSAFIDVVLRQGLYPSIFLPECVLRFVLTVLILNNPALEERTEKSLDKELPFYVIGQKGNTIIRIKGLDSYVKCLKEILSGSFREIVMDEIVKTLKSLSKLEKKEFFEFFACGVIFMGKKRKPLDKPASKSPSQYPSTTIFQLKPVEQETLDALARVLDVVSIDEVMETLSKLINAGYRSLFVFCLIKFVFLVMLIHRDKKTHQKDVDAILDKLKYLIIGKGNSKVRQFLKPLCEPSPNFSSLFSGSDAKMFKDYFIDHSVREFHEVFEYFKTQRDGIKEAPFKLETQKKVLLYDFGQDYKDADKDDEERDKLYPVFGAYYLFALAEVAAN